MKRAATRHTAREIVLYDRDRDDREAIGRRLAEERGLTVVPPYDHRDVIAGQGTAARELFEESGPARFPARPLRRRRPPFGSGARRQALSPGCRVIGVEPEAGDDATRSFRTKELQTVKNPQTVADGARTPSLGL